MNVSRQSALWFHKHFRQRLRRFQNRIIQRTIMWLLEERPNEQEIIGIYRNLEKEPEMDFFERYRLK